MKKIIIALLGAGILILIVVAGLRYSDRNNEPALTAEQTNNTPTPSASPASTTATASPKAPIDTKVSVVAQNLTIPWDIAFLPEGGMLVTERPGRLVHFAQDGTKKSIVIENVRTTGESGLLGVTLHPDFEQNRMLYLYITQASGGGLINRVERYVYREGKLSDRKTIITNIPGALYHDGGRMEFGPDGLLYITTGDATNEHIAQDKNSLGGKVLRLNADGTIPPSNPFGTAVYSFGHRNSQGLAWDPEGRLWSTEHGRSGIQSGLDEINLIVAGANYGWPTIEGNETQAGMTAPALHSGASATWAPASALYWDGSLFFGGLRGQGLYEAKLEGTKVVSLKKHFSDEYGRIRTVRLGPDGMFYFTTSNKDNRGSIKPNDDKILKVNPARFR
ncbi:MAG: PQQ-dependent sugar dehydrogenase [bacterium]|nr:PQQ-dependent sugar dehydrogenase [bacterium]